MMTENIRPMRVGVIGTGKHGSRYAHHLVHDIPGLLLQAVSRRSAKGAVQAGQWQCRYHRDWQGLVVADDVDAVISVVPPALNKDIALACAKAQKPLLLEKPLAGSLEDARFIERLSRHEGLHLMVGHTLRYNAVVGILKTELPNLGPMFSFAANQRLEPATLEWLHAPELAGAGVSFHTAVHVFDALRLITGREIVRVSAVTRCHGKNPLEDLLAVLLEMEDGVVGTVDCSKVGHARSGSFQFVGEKGQLWGDHIYNRVTKVKGQALSDLSPKHQVHTIMPLLGDFQKFLRGAPNPIPAKEGLAAVQICEACLKSARDGRWVGVTP